MQFISAPVSGWFFDLHRACRVTLGMLLLLVLPGTSGVANAATPNDYPARPVRLISPFAPGGGNDLISRTLGQEMSKNLGQPVVVDNRPGANAIIGMQIVATAP
ncbi:MAG TPA: tripartite tricarboxylate transporter substrate-binding protein, partial [Burkholderiales bacterium]|nr:tripartite tricarboxylate transporter substrate-binding protein [Burkholderiales bacterium]